ncbi:MAG: Subtilisin-like serine protease [Bacteroidetes bacterium]|nr:Subtilisin-like serine protease [Bacteroidota bacterium]
MLQLTKKLSAVVLAACVSSLAFAQHNGTAVTTANPTHFVLPANLKAGDFMDKTIIIKVKSEYRSACSNEKINNADFLKLYNTIGGSGLAKKFPLVTAPEKKVNAQGQAYADLSLIYEFKYSANVSFEKIINTFKNLGILEYAEPHYIPHISSSYVPNDPGLMLQYGITNIQAEPAWGINTTSARGDTNVVIGITDTGTELTHDDLQGNLKHNYADPVNGVDDDGDGYIDNNIGWDLGDNDNDPTWTGNQHGVHVCGIAAATTDNNTGGVGVGFHCKYMPVKIADASGALTKAYEGIQYAAAHGCNIINCSWGGAAAGQFQQDIITYATINENALVVAAAGNDGMIEDFYPASLQYVTSVANTDNSDVASSSTNYGYSIDVCAPGENIYSTFPPNSYAYETGTSMASPCAAGAAAIIKSFYPSYNALQIGEQLKVTCDNIYPVNTAAYTNRLGKGRINLYRALTETTSPSVVMTSRVDTDNNDNTFVANDTIRMRGMYTNYLAPAANVIATLTAIGASSTNITILDGTTTLGAMGQMGTANNNADPFTIRVKPTAPLNTLIQFKLTFTDAATSYTASQYFTLTVNVDYINININDVATTMTSSGRIGYRADGEAGGLGFNYMNGGTLLYEGGLMIGTGTSKVSNVVRGVTPGASDADFQSAMTVHSVLPSTVSEFDVDGIINDIPAATGVLPVTIRNRGYAWSSAGNRKYIIIEYTISNTGAAALNNLYAGIFADWDIDAATFGSDRASFDAADRMGYAYYSGAAGKYAGIKLLSHTGGVNHYAIDNVVGGAGGMDINTGGFGIDEKYTAMSTNRTDAGVAGAGADICDVVSSGPFTIAAGDSVKVAFALIAGDSLLDLQTSAANAQIMYDGLLPSGVTENQLDGNGMFIYPNPAAGKSTIDMTIAQSGMVEIKLYDMLGREVKTVVSERMAAGDHVLSVDVSSLQNGLYYYHMTVDNKKYTYKLMIAK